MADIIETSHYLLGQGLLERSWICGVLPFEILASHILSQLGVILVQALSHHNYMQAFSLIRAGSLINSVFLKGWFGLSDRVWHLRPPLSWINSSHRLDLTSTRCDVTDEEAYDDDALLIEIDSIFTDQGHLLGLAWEHFLKH